MLGVSFLLCALLLAGLPPLSGFLAKFAMLAPMLEAPSRAGTMTLFTLVIVSGFCTVIALCRAGIQIFWADADRHFPRSEERRGGKGCGSTGRYRWGPDH